MKILRPSNLDIKLIDRFLGIHISGGFHCDDVTVFIEDVEHNGAVIFPRRVLVEGEPR